MGIGSLLAMLIIGAIAGWLAGKIVAGYGFGVLGNIVVGIVGRSSQGSSCRASASRWAAARSPRSSIPPSAR